jgi:hypothetical protein
VVAAACSAGCGAVAIGAQPQVPPIATARAAATAANRAQGREHKRGLIIRRGYCERGEHAVRL